MPDRELNRTKKSRSRPADTVALWRFQVPWTLGRAAAFHWSKVILEKFSSRRTIDICSIPLTGRVAPLRALVTSSEVVTLPWTSWTSQPMLLSSWTNSSSSGPEPAFRDRYIKWRAPCSTIHLEVARPNPPRPPTRRYEAESDSCRVMGRSEIVASRSLSSRDLRIDIQILPMC